MVVVLLLVFWQVIIFVGGGGIGNVEAHLDKLINPGLVTQGSALSKRVFGLQKFQTDFIFSDQIRVGDFGKRKFKDRLVVDTENQIRI